MKTILISLCLIISCGAFAQNSDCKKFKNGTFYLTFDGLTSVITRKGSKQIETMERLGLKIKYKVKWLDDCSYTLTFKRILENPNNIDFEDVGLLTIEMTEIKEKSYLQKSTFAKNGFEFECVIFIKE